MKYYNLLSLPVVIFKLSEHDQLNYVKLNEHDQLSYVKLPKGIE